MGQLAEYKSHKIIKAGKIISIHTRDRVMIEDCNGEASKIDVPENIFARGIPLIGDYIIIYEDGYKSWSPAKAFEEGYTRI